MTQLAVALAVALTGLPFLSRSMHRLVGTAIALAALAALVGGYGLPLNVASAIALGWGMAAACHLAFGSARRAALGGRGYRRGPRSPGGRARADPDGGPAVGRGGVRGPG